MLTILTALAALSACTAARWYLDRTSRRETEYAGGRLRLRAMWNGGAAFGLPIRKAALPAASLAALGMLWTQRRRSPVGVGLSLGGGLSNLLERLRRGSVYDYIQFPKAPGRLKRYVFNLADFAILLGGVCLALRRKKR
nr:signal peptidase II [uncultured Dysosmobacter sp.]